MMDEPDSMDTISRMDGADNVAQLDTPDEPAPPASRAPRDGSRDLAILLVALPAIGFAVLGVFFATSWMVLGRSLYPTIKLLYFLGTVAFPGTLLGFGAVAWVLWTRRRHRALGRAGWGLLLGALAIFGVRVYATNVEPSLLRVRRITIASPKIHAPLRIVHISDLQAPAVRGYERRAVRLVNSLHPDLVIHTGDLLQPVRPATFETEKPKLDALLRQIQAPLGVYNVEGDCDDEMREAFQKGFGGMRTLYNEAATVEAKGTRLRLLGLDLNASDGQDTRHWADPWLAGAASGDFTILLGHRPDFVDQVRALPVDLCLAGHTHGGQIRIPFYGPIITETRLPCELARGFHPVGATWLNVSAAVGSEHIHEMPAMRLNCPSELTVIELMPAADRKTFSSS
jgi:predicted MPP superfamily phosphohydrolase